MIKRRSSGPPDYTICGISESREVDAITMVKMTSAHFEVNQLLHGDIAVKI